MPIVFLTHPITLNLRKILYVCPYIINMSKIVSRLYKNGSNRTCSPPPFSTCIETIIYRRYASTDPFLLFQLCLDRHRRSWNDDEDVVLFLMKKWYDDGFNGMHSWVDRHGVYIGIQSKQFPSTQQESNGRDRGHCGFSVGVTRLSATLFCSAFVSSRLLPSGLLCADRMPAAGGHHSHLLVIIFTNSS